VRYGWLDQSDLEPHPKFSSARVDFALVQPFRMALLRRAAKKFFSLNNEMHYEFKEFCNDEKAWLDDYALFMAIAEQHNHQEWSLWPTDLVHRTAGVKQGEKEYADEFNLEILPSVLRASGYA
jgi:4-alpha-glucanotransferase